MPTYAVKIKCRKDKNGKRKNETKKIEAPSSSDAEQQMRSSMPTGTDILDVVRLYGHCDVGHNISAMRRF